MCTENLHCQQSATIILHGQNLPWHPEQVGGGGVIEKALPQHSPEIAIKPAFWPFDITWVAKVGLD